MGKGVKLATQSSVQIEFLYEGIRCRERIKFNPATTQLDVVLKKTEEHRKAIIEQIDKGVFDYEAVFPGSKNLKKFSQLKTLTLAKWFDVWIEEVRPHLRTSTVESYFQLTKVINRKFGTVRLVDITKEDVKTWCKDLTVSNVSISHYLVVFRGALQFALESDHVSQNVLHNFKFKLNDGPDEHIIDPFNKDEQKAILDAMTGHYKNFFRFAFWTGMRTSELIALEWRDVNWNKGVINVVRARTATAKIPERTKTKSGRREVKILEPAMTALLAQKELTFDRANIFIDPKTDLPLRGPSPIRWVWTKALKKAEVRYRKPYQTRHTYASMMLSANEPIAWVSRQIGHGNVMITAKTYATWIPDSQPNVGSNAVDLFS